MNNKLAWADRSIAVIFARLSADTVFTHGMGFANLERPDGTKGSVIPVIVRPNAYESPPVGRPQSDRSDELFSEAEASRRLHQGRRYARAARAVKPASKGIEGEAPDSDHAGPVDKPTFIPVSADDGVPRWLKLSVAIAAVVGTIFAALTFFFGGGGASQRECKTILGGMVVCGDYKDERVQHRN